MPQGPDTRYVRMNCSKSRTKNRRREEDKRRGKEGRGTRLRLREEVIDVLVFTWGVLLLLHGPQHAMLLVAAF